MPPRDDLREAAAELEGSVVVCGVGDYADTVAAVASSDSRFVGMSEFVAAVGPSTAAVDEASAVGGEAGVGSPAAVVIAVDPSGSSTGAEPPIEAVEEADAVLEAIDATGAFTVAVVPGCGASADDLSALGERVDAVLLAGDGSESVDAGAVTDADAVADAIRTFLAVVQEPGFVNLDLTDAETVLSSGTAALGVGSGARDAPSVAVDDAFSSLPTDVDPTDASAVLVDVVVDPVTSIAAATDAIAAVRERIGVDANVIWGGAVDESAAAELTVRVVVADVRHAPVLDAGDPCPRCDAPLSAYAFGASETLSCDACGYSGISMRRD
ncbi:hypothetical protein [Halorubrum trueperi]|uniref:Tubulin/FtsZ 2-layer sandwich domain-containing protein n=1 Tax=Halorubrum trueperi TaxID=2004704 RepID=A0ABD5UMM6_9EURY